MKKYYSVHSENNCLNKDFGSFDEVKRFINEMSEEDMNIVQPTVEEYTDPTVPETFKIIFQFGTNNNCFYE